MTLHRLSGFDASLLALEGPKQQMHQCSLAELDISAMPGGYDFAKFRETISARTDSLPEFRAKLADSPLNLDTPVWVEDRNFDIDRHVHRIHVLPPGGRRELASIASELATAALDRERPLWDIWLIEGLGGSDPQTSGRIAVVVRTHHVFADGVTSGDLWAQLHAADADAPQAGRVEGFGDATARQIVVEGLIRLIRRPRLLVRTVLPATFRAVATTCRRSRRSAAMPSPFSAPRTPFNGDVGQRRTVAYVRLNLADIQVAKNAFGVKVNDVLLAVIAGAVRQFLATRAALPDTAMMAMMPMSVRDEHRASRNQMSAMFASLHTDIPDPIERLLAIAKASTIAKDHHHAAIGPELLQDWTEFAPSLLTVVMRAYRASGLSKRRPAYNLSLSNVRSSQTKILGAPIISNFPFGPVLDGVGLNVTAASLNGNVDIGFVACPQLLPDLWDLADGLSGALQELLDAAS